MNDIRIPDWQSRGRGFVSLILHLAIAEVLFGIFRTDVWNDA